MPPTADAPWLDKQSPNKKGVEEGVVCSFWLGSVRLSVLTEPVSPILLILAVTCGRNDVAQFLEEGIEGGAGTAAVVSCVVN